MAGLNCIAETAEVALVAATAKTVLQIVAPTNQRGRVKEWGVYFDGTSPTAEPVVVEVLYQTTAGTMTALTVEKEDQSQTETVQFTAQHTATAEPTSGAFVRRKNVHPQGGFEWVAPMGDEINVGGGKRLAIRCTAPANVNVIAYMRFDE